MDVSSFASSSLPLGPDFLAIVKRCVNNDSNDGCEGKTISESKSCGEEDGRVFAVELRIQGILWRKNPGDIITHAGIIKVPASRHGEVFGIECSGVMNAEASNDGEDENTNHGVGNRVEGEDERTSQESSNDCPVKCDGNQGKSSLSAKKLIHDDIVGSSPADECESGEERSDPEREPFPDEYADKHNQKVLVATDCPRPGFECVWSLSCVDCLKHCGDDQVGWPNHGSWLNEPFPGKTSKT